MGGVRPEPPKAMVGWGCVTTVGVGGEGAATDGTAGTPARGPLNLYTPLGLASCTLCCRASC